MNKKVGWNGGWNRTRKPNPQEKVKKKYNFRITTR